MDVNKVILLGNLTRDPETHKMSNGKDLARFSIATSRKFKDKEGNRREDAQFTNVVVFAGPLVTIVDHYCQKGTRVYIEGELQTRKYEANDGTTKYATEVVLNPYRGRLEIQARGRGREEGQASDHNDAGRPTPNGHSARQADDSPDYFDDDIPF